MTTAEPARRPVRPLRIVTAGAAFALVAIASGAGWWWYLSHQQPPPLARDWRARVITIAGDGTVGASDGDPDRARFGDPFGIAMRPDGAVFISDAGDSPRIRGIAPDGRVFTLAGGIRGFADGAGDAARFDTPSGLAIDGGGAIYVADTANNAIRRITPDGVVTTVAGGGPAGYQDGRGAQAQFNGPLGIAADARGRIIVADTYNDRIRVIAPDGEVSTLAGDGMPGAADGAGPEARFDTPGGVAVDRAGNVLVADTGNGAVRVIDTAGQVTTLTAGDADGLVRPVGIGVNDAGDIYVTDDRGRLVEIHGDGTARVVAGSVAGFRDGAGGDARFRRPSGVAAVAPGRVIVSDSGNALIRLVAAESRLELRVPPSPRIAPRFDDEAFGATPLLWPIAPMDGPHEIAGTLGEARGGQGERFHAGIDVREDEGTLVHADRDGAISSPLSNGEFDSLNEWVRIGALAYVHVRAGRTRANELTDPSRFVGSYENGRLVRIRVKRGARFTAGDVVGSVNRFNHVHLNVGWPGEERNPLLFRLTQFEDGKAPTIAGGGVRLYDESWQPLVRRGQRRLPVSGRLRIVVDAWDQADGNRPNRRLGLYSLGYEVLNRDGSPAAGSGMTRETIRFDRLGPQTDAARIVYAPGSGIPFYRGGRTKFLYVVTNTLRGGVATEGFWDTSVHAPGDYTLRILAADVRGNVAIGNRDVPVTIAAKP